MAVSLDHLEELRNGPLVGREAVAATRAFTAPADRAVGSPAGLEGLRGGVAAGTVHSLKCSGWRTPALTPSTRYSARRGEFDRCGRVRHAQTLIRRHLRARSLTAMAFHVLERSQRIGASAEEVFGFFADPRNLEEITPPWL